MNRKEAFEALEEILDGLTEESEWRDAPGKTNTEKFLSGIYSILESDYLGFHAELLKRDYSMDAILLFALATFCFYVDENYDNAFAIFRADQAAKFLRMDVERILAACKELSEKLSGTEDAIDFTYEDGIIVLIQGQ